MEKISNQTEIAVIFKRVQMDAGTVFMPQDVVIGSFDKKNMSFTTLEGNKYCHIFGTKEKYGFAMRNKVGVINCLYKKRTFSKLRNAYLKDLKLDFYYYTATDIDTYQDITFFSEDSKHHTTISINDVDLERVRLKVLKERAQKNEPAENNISTKELIQEVKNKVVGQDTAIEQLVSVLWQNSKSDWKNNVLLVGSTGVGKTEIVRVIAQKLKLPIVIVDASNLTKSGYIGNSVEDILVRLLFSCDNNLEKAERGIIVLDEIDKLAKSGGVEDFIATTGVQYELLKILEDGTYSVNMGDKTITINTKNIMVIGTGAFSDMNKIKKEKKASIGFQTQGQTSISKERNEKNLTIDDFINYGFIPEFMGRFTNIISLDSLTKEDFITILKSPSTDTLKNKLQILENEGIELVIEENVYEEVAKAAMKKNTGARGLRSVIDSLFVDAMLEISQNNGVFEKLIIDETTLKNPKNYRLIKKR